MRKWIGDALGIAILGGPFLIGPFIGAAMVDEDERAIMLLLAFAMLGTVALLISAWRRAPTWHLLCLPGVAAAVLAFGARAWGHARHHDDDVGFTGAARFLARSARLSSVYWAGLGAALTLLLGFTALVWAVSARSGRPLRRGFWRAGALGVAFFGTCAIPLLEWRSAHASDDFSSIASTWPIGGVVMIAALAIFIAGGAEQEDEESRSRVLLACLYAIASVLCACMVRTLVELGELHGWFSNWSEIAADAENNLAESNKIFQWSSLFLLPIILSSALVVCRWPFWRSRVVRTSAVALFAPLVVLASVWMRSRQESREIASLDIPTPPGFAPLHAPIVQRCSLEPGYVVFLGDRIRQGEEDLGPISLLDDFDATRNLHERLGAQAKWALAVDASVRFDRVARFIDATMSGCDNAWIVWDHGHSRCVALRNIRNCSSLGDELLDVTVGEQGLDVARIESSGTVLEPSKKTSTDALAAMVVNLRPQTEASEHRLRGAILRAPSAMAMKDVITTYAALVGPHHTVTLEDGSHLDDDHVRPILDVSFAIVEERNELVDAKALGLSAADGMSLCRDKQCTLATWRTLELKEATQYANNDSRKDAIETAFLVLALDRNGLDGSQLDASIVDAAKKLKQPFERLVADRDPPPAIARVVSANEGALRSCVAELDLRRTIRADTWHFEVTVDAAGLVAAFAGEGDIARGTARICLERAFRAMRFERQASPVKVRYALHIADETTNDFGQRRGPGRSVQGAVTLRMGATQVTGLLPPEVIQRIVRQNFGRFRLCYENNVRSNANAGGRVTVRFTIDETGAVSSMADDGSDLPNKDAIACVVKAFGGLSFPQPEKGKVVVVYPMVFSSND